MTAKQKRFCAEYLIDQNGTQAAIRAGYSPHTAAEIAKENLNKPYIREYIDEELQRMQDETIADATEVMQYLTSVLRGEHKEQALKFVDKGKQDVVEVDVSEKDRLKAAELLGKAGGMFTDKTNINVNLPVIVEGEDKLED